MLLENFDEIFRDQLLVVEQINSTRMRKRGLLEPVLNIDTAVELARPIENAIRAKVYVCTTRN